MALIAPNLDDRKFQDIVSEARSKIPLYCPKWTDYNLADPGITLIELFAWMVDMLLYRLNKVPDKNYIKFMDLLGIRLEPPKPAKVEVTFRLSATQPEAVTIPRGTEVATVRTETEEAISFTTEEDLTIILPTIAYALITPDSESFEDCMPALKNPDKWISIFQETPEENNALYLGYNEDLAGHMLVLNINSSIGGIGVDPHDPPLVWEYWDGEYERWFIMRLETDTTGGLNTTGQVIVHLPDNSRMRELNGQFACWIRCRAIKPRPGQRPYSSSPKILSITSETIGGTVKASHAFRNVNEILGRSDGKPGQNFWLQDVPVLSRESGEIIEVETEVEDEFEAWQEVKDFANSNADDKHFTCDSVTGEIQFGPSIRQPTGEEKQYGMIPPKGRLIRFTAYRCGGGVIGNVGEGTITVLKSSIPYVASVTNFEAARGGIDQESLESAKMRAPQIPRARTRAVTAEDFEYLTLESSSKIARAKCIFPGSTDEGDRPPPGIVRLLLVPDVEEYNSIIPAEDLEITRGVQAEVQEYLDERRLLATRLEIGVPKYIPVSIEVHLKGKNNINSERIIIEVEKRLYRYINPVHGGTDGKGWQFGYNLSLSETYAVLQGIPGVEYVESVKLSYIDSETGERKESTNKIDVPADSLVCSDKHVVIVG